MDDLISREAAIDAVCRHGTELERRGITVLAVANHKQVTVDLLESLPSAESPRGFWVTIERGEQGYSAGDFRCSICGKPNKCYTMTAYCPNCGADMRGEDNG